MSPISPSLRRPSSTRMDVLSAVMKIEALASPSASIGPDDSPRDSLSPLDSELRKSELRTNSDRNQDDDSRGRGSLLPLRRTLAQRREATAESQAGTRDREVQTEQDSADTFQASLAVHEAATVESEKACSPRSPLLARPRRPADLHLTKSNGLTTHPLTQLKQAIIAGDGHTDPCATRTPVPREPVAMGNTASSPAAAGDNESLRSVVRRNPTRILRKTSTNLFKRIDSKSPLPRNATATTILVVQDPSSASSPTTESPIDPFTDPAYLARDSVIMPHSASTVTVTEDNADQPLSASSTLKDLRPASGGSRFHEAQSDTDSELDRSLSPPPVPPHRSSALSPTIPAPSPLPEDSPHKYGLKDRMDTPELVREPPRHYQRQSDEVEVKKTRRRSSGVEIFNVRFNPLSHYMPHYH